MKIAVIDSGIDKSFLCKGRLFLDMIVGKEGRLCERTVEPLLTSTEQFVLRLLKNIQMSRRSFTACVFSTMKK